MPALNPSEVLQALGSGDLDSQLRAVRDIKNGIIGNRRKKTAFSSAGAVPRLVEILSRVVHENRLDALRCRAKEQGLAPSSHASQCPQPSSRPGAPLTAEGGTARSEMTVHAVAALGSFAFGSSEGNAAVMSAGAFPLLQELLYSRNDKIVASAARTMRILLEGNPPASQHIFQRDCGGNKAQQHTSTTRPHSVSVLAGGDKIDVAVADNLSTVERLLQLIAVGQDGTSDVAASLLARACQTREQQFALSRARAWEITDGLLLSSPKGQEAGLDLAASMVRGNAEQAEFMLRRPRTDLATLLEFVRHRRPYTRLLACTCVARAVACGALCMDKFHHEVSTVLHTAIKLFLTEPHKGIKEAAPNVVALLIRHNESLQSAALESGLSIQLVAQCEAPGASSREKIAVMWCLECMAAGDEDFRAQVGEAGAMRLVGACIRDPTCSEKVLGAACSLLLALSRSVRNLRTCIGDEPELCENLCRLLTSDQVRLRDRVSAALCNLVIVFSPVRARLLACGVLPVLVKFLSCPQDLHLGARDVVRVTAEETVGAGKSAGETGDKVMDEVRLNSFWALRNLTYKADAKLKQSIVQELRDVQLLEMLDSIYASASAKGFVGLEGEILENTVGMVRNLSQGDVCGVSAVLEAVGGEGAGDGLARLLRILAQCTRDSVPNFIAMEAVGVLGNMAASCKELRLAIGKNSEVLVQLHGILMSKVRGVRIKSETCWCLVNILPSRKRVEATLSGVGGARAGGASWSHVGAGLVEGERGTRPRAGGASAARGRRIEGGEEDAEMDWNDDHQIPEDKSERGIRGLVGRGSSDLGEGPSARAQSVENCPREGSVGGIGRGKSSSVVQGHGGNEHEKAVGSEACWEGKGGDSEQNSEAEILSILRRVCMWDGVRKLLSEHHLDADLCRKLRQMGRVLLSEQDDEHEEDESESVEEEDIDGQDDGNDWVIMTPHMHALQDQEGLDVDEEEEESEEFPGPVSRQGGEWRTARSRPGAEDGQEASSVNDGITQRYHPLQHVRIVSSGDIITREVRLPGGEVIPRDSMVDGMLNEESRDSTRAGMSWEVVQPRLHPRFRRRMWRAQQLVLEGDGMESESGQEVHVDEQLVVEEA